MPVSHHVQCEFVLLKVKDILNLHCCQNKSFSTALPAVLLSLSPRTSPTFFPLCGNPRLVHKCLLSALVPLKGLEVS